MARSLRVVVDARLVSGQAGGVEGVVTGLASGLGVLDEPDRFDFVVWEGQEDWLIPFLGSNSNLLRIAEPTLEATATPRHTLRQRVGDKAPLARSVWRSVNRRPAAGTPPGPQPADRRITAAKPNIVHLPIQSGFLSAAPTIYHPHDLQHVHLPEFFDAEERARRERWYGQLCRKAGMVAVASDWTRRDVTSHYGLPATRVRVVPLAPPLTTKRSAEIDAGLVLARWSLPERFALYPAQTWAHKNHAGLFRALAILRSRGLVLDLVLTGRETAFGDELRKLAETLDVAEQIHWLGFVPRDDLVALYSTAYAVVVPTLFEAASGPLWEAFDAGVPAACSNVTSLPEQASDAAIVFDPRDDVAIANAVEMVWTNHEVRNRLREAGHRQIGARSWPLTARTFVAHYRRLARRPLSAADEALIRLEPRL
jgi:glycosyltransferase involved in cell wall biosynthesis